MLINLFLKEIPLDLPKSMEIVAKKLSNSTGKKECLERTYDLLGNKYRGYRIKTFIRSFDFFTDNLESVWNRTGFLHCMTLNYLMRVLLIKSGHFKEEDVRQRWTTIWLFSPHQYLEVRLGRDKIINVDLWGRVYGIPLGDYAHGFNSMPRAKLS
ncbi:hypothetical protein KKH05_01060 [Patescibacteria group bacterium]|nr:hypothetical protein [Patescibacteria group bacterium]